METRISESKVDGIISSLEKKLAAKMAQTDSDLKEKVGQQLREITEKVDLVNSFAERHHNDLKFEVKKYSVKMEKSVEMD